MAVEGPVVWDIPWRGVGNAYAGGGGEDGEGIGIAWVAGSKCDCGVGLAGAGTGAGTGTGIGGASLIDDTFASANDDVEAPCTEYVEATDNCRATDGCFAP